MSRALFVTIATLVAPIGCALLVDTGDLSNGGASPGPDAASAADAATDVVVESGSDGAPADTCNETFYDSFDGPLGEKWDTLAQSGAMFTIDESSYASAPSALFVTLVSEGGKATLTKRFTAAKTVCCTVAMRGYADYLSLFELQGRGGNYRIVFDYGSGSFGVTESLYVADGDPANINRDVGALERPSADPWRRLRVELTYPSATAFGNIRVYDDGTLALSASIGSDKKDIAIDRLLVGITYSEKTLSAVIGYDDVGCTVH